MSKMKKYLSLVLLVVFTLSVVLTGCGTTAAPKAETKAETTKVEEPKTEAAKTDAAPVALKWFLVGPGQEPETAKICAEANKYLKEKLNMNVTIDLQVFGYGDPYNNKVNTMLSAGEPFDICFTAGWAADIKSNSASGYFKPLDDYLAKSDKITQIVGKPFLEGCKIAGKTYAVPCNKEQVHNWGFLVKKDLADKYKLDAGAIKKMEDMEPFFAQVLKGEKGITPLLTVEMESPYRLLDWDVISDNGVPGALYPDNRDTKIINQFFAPETMEFYKKMREYNQKGYVSKDAATMQNFNDQLKTGKYAAVCQSLKPGKAGEMKGSTGGIDWVQIDITKPVMSNNDISGGALLAIPAASKHPDEAFKFIEALYTDTYLSNLFIYGIEGQHYEKVAGKENVVKLLGGEKSGYKAGNGWRFGDQFKDYLMDTEDPQKWAQFLAYNKAGTPTKSVGFAYDKKNVDTEIASCIAVVKTYYKQLLAGSVDVDSTVKKFKSDLDKAGVAKVITDMQTQYDAWLKANGK